MRVKALVKYRKMIVVVFCILTATVLFDLYRFYFLDSGYWPYFSFFRSASCLEKYESTNGPRNCYLQSNRLNKDPTNFSDAISSTKMLYIATNNVVSFDKLNQTIDPKDWDCKEKYFLNDFLNKDTPDPNNKDPRLDGVYYCWPKTPLPEGITLKNSK